MINVEQLECRALIVAEATKETYLPTSASRACHNSTDFGIVVTWLGR